MIRVEGAENGYNMIYSYISGMYPQRFNGTGHAASLVSFPRTYFPYISMLQDELCLLSPTFAPSFFYVGKLSIDIPLAWDLSKPVKILVSDVLGVVRVRDHHESMTAEVRSGLLWHQPMTRFTFVCLW